VLTKDTTLKFFIIALAKEWRICLPANAQYREFTGFTKVLSTSNSSIRATPWLIHIIFGFISDL